MPSPMDDPVTVLNTRPLVRYAAEPAIPVAEFRRLLADERAGMTRTRDAFSLARTQ